MIVDDEGKHVVGGHDTSSNLFGRHKHAEVKEFLRVLSFFNFQTIQLLNLQSESAGGNLVLELTSFTVLKYFVDEMLFDKSVIRRKT